MQRIPMSERPNWKDQAEALGFGFHTMYGQPYWDETAAWRFTLREIEDDLEDPSANLHRMCLEAVARIVDNERDLDRLAIPPDHRDLVRQSWKRGDPSLLGRFDLAYDGGGPAKLLEYNADTPTSLYETGYFQWLWLEEGVAEAYLPAGADQFNSLQDKLIARLGDLFVPGAHIHFGYCQGSEEDRATVRYLEDCAQQAGLVPHPLAVETIAVDAQGRLADPEGHVLDVLFKLYPWGMMMRDAFAAHLATTPALFLEPPWKAVLSNKGLLAVLWEMFPGHPNLLPAYFEDDPRVADITGAYVVKPLYSREGANVEIRHRGDTLMATKGQYGAEGRVVQALAPLATAEGNHSVIGSWIVGEEPAGIGIREDRSRITRDLSRFVPHYIDG